MPKKVSAARPRVVIIGAGFGGLAAARALGNTPVDVLIIDRRNHHTFVPLLYEVAAAGLQPADIAQPIRSILHSYRNVRCQLARVASIDLRSQRLRTDKGVISYDYLIVAAGSISNDFGIPGVTEHALALKDLDEASEIRNTVLSSLERGAVAPLAPEAKALLTVVVIGGGPTGVELAGAMAELRSHVVPRDYPELAMSSVRVILLEATDKLLPAFPLRLQREAHRQLLDLGVDVRLSAKVAAVSPEGVRLADGTEIASTNVIWVAGVRASNVGFAGDVTLKGSGRVAVMTTLHLPSYSNVYVVGDMAHVQTRDDRGYPMLAPAAMQQGQLAAANVLRSVSGQPPLPFAYRDRGIMATIGRQRAVAHVFGLQLTGIIAWLGWLFVHVIQIIGLRNKMLVLVNWAWNYARYDRSHRLITGSHDERAQTPLSKGSTG